MEAAPPHSANEVWLVSGSVDFGSSQLYAPSAPLMGEWRDTGRSTAHTP